LIFLTSAYIASIQHVYDIININPGVAMNLKPGFDDNDVLLLISLVDIYNNDVNDVEHENDLYNTSAPTTIHATCVASSMALYCYMTLCRSKAALSGMLERDYYSVYFDSLINLLER